MSDFGDQMASALDDLYAVHGVDAIYIDADGAQAKLMVRRHRESFEKVAESDARTHREIVRVRKSELPAVDEGADRIRLFVRGKSREMDVADLLDETENEWTLELQ